MAESALVFRAAEPIEVATALRLYQQAQASGYLEDYSPSNPFQIQVCALFGVEYITVVVLSALMQLRMSLPAASQDLELVIIADSATMTATMKKNRRVPDAVDSALRSVLELLVAARVPIEHESSSGRAATRIVHDDNNQPSSLTRLIVCKDAIQAWASNPISYERAQ